MDGEPYVLASQFCETEERKQQLANGATFVSEFWVANAKFVKPITITVTSCPQ